jgi:hypothetical protein
MTREEEKGGRRDRFRTYDPHHVKMVPQLTQADDLNRNGDFSGTRQNPTFAPKSAQIGGASEAVTSEARDRALLWLATSATIDGLAGFRDGYSAIEKSDFEHNRELAERRRGGQLYAVGYEHGRAVSALLHLTTLGKPCARFIGEPYSGPCATCGFHSYMHAPGVGKIAHG